MELTAANQHQSGVLCLLPGCTAIKTFPAGFVQGMKFQNNCQLLSLKLGHTYELRTGKESLC